MGHLDSDAAVPVFCGDQAWPSAIDVCGYPQTTQEVCSRSCHFSTRFAALQIPEPPPTGVQVGLIEQQVAPSRTREQSYNRDRAGQT